MKKQFTDILGGAIYLDLISGASKPSFIPRNLYNKLCVYGDKRTFKKLDFLLIAKKGENIYINDLYKPENNMIKYVNFPVFTNKASDSEIFFDTKKVNLVYAGTLNQDYRNPTPMLRIIEMISNKVKGLSLHLFGRNNCKEIIDTFKKNSSFEIIEHGIVEHDIVISAYNNADLLINISNSVENIIPSKIFELFATGKPIINFNSSECDGLNEFASKYPSFFRVPENIGSEDFNSLLTFIKTEKGKKYDFELIKRNFYENTPEYFVDIIENEFTRLIN